MKLAGLAESEFDGKRFESDAGRNDGKPVVND